MIQPKISVVTVCYNAINDIEKTILSVINQTYSNIEYIIIDGGSTDGTMDIVNKYKDKIDVIVSEPDKGIYDAMNKGARKSCGDFVQFLNAGDVLYNEKVFSSLFKEEISVDVDVVYGDVIYVMQFGRFYKVPEPIENFSVTFPIAHPASFVKRKIFDTFEFNTKYRIAADFALLKQIYDNSGKFLYKQDIPVVIFDSISGVSSKSVYKAWYEFNLVLGNQKLHYWSFKCFLKKMRIVMNENLYNVLDKICHNRLMKFLVQKQLKNNTFKLIS